MLRLLLLLVLRWLLTAVTVTRTHTDTARSSLTAGTMRSSAHSSMGSPDRRLSQMNAIHLAARYGCAGVVANSLKAGARINKAHKAGDPPL